MIFILSSWKVGLLTDFCTDLHYSQFLVFSFLRLATVGLRKSQNTSGAKIGSHFNHSLLVQTVWVMVKAYLPCHPRFVNLSQLLKCMTLF